MLSQPWPGPVLDKLLSVRPRKVLECWAIQLLLGSVEMAELEAVELSGLCYMSVRKEGQGAGAVDWRTQHGMDGTVT